MNIYALELARLPNTTLEILLRLAKTLRRDKPKASNVVIEAALGRLAGVIERVEQALIARLIANNPELQASEVAFDRAVDGLWLMLRRSLEERAAYAAPGFDLLAPELAAKAQLEVRREEARRAQRLWTRLFASAGTNFTKQRFIVQAGSMATLLGMIEQEGLRAELDAVLGPELMQMLEACQQQYEDMVGDRLSREQGASENLNELRRELRWAIVAYVQAVHSLYDPAQPESEEAVLAALRPILVLREELVRSGGALDEPELEDFVELELPDFEGADADADADPDADELAESA